MSEADSCYLHTNVYTRSKTEARDSSKSHGEKRDVTIYFQHVNIGVCNLLIIICKTH